MSALAAELEQARGRLRKVPAPPASGPNAAPASGLSPAEVARIRAVTGCHSEADRVRYFMRNGMDAWLGELETSLRREGSLGKSGGDADLSGITFPTKLVAMGRDEKLAIHALFRELFVRPGLVEDASAQAAVGGTAGAADSFFARLQPVLAAAARRVDAGEVAPALMQRLDAAVRAQPDGAFVKLSTRSPKDSLWAVAGARGRMHAERGREDASSATGTAPQLSLSDDRLDHNALFVAFAEHLRLQQRARSGRDALLLLATSARVYEDLGTELFDTETPESEQQGSNAISVSVRAFDRSVTPDTEFRGFVWDRRLVCCGQYFHPMFFGRFFGDESSTPEADRYLARAERDLRRFVDEDLISRLLPDFFRKCPCAMLDLVWAADGRAPRLTEVNPFDGEAVGVFPASTGLFSWFDAADRRLMMGEVPFELRVRREPLITAENLRRHPKLRNVSPVWKEAIYGDVPVSID